MAGRIFGQRVLPTCVKDFVSVRGRLLALQERRQPGSVSPLAKSHIGDPECLRNGEHSTEAESGAISVLRVHLPSGYCRRAESLVSPLGSERRTRTRAKKKRLPKMASRFFLRTLRHTYLQVLWLDRVMAACPPKRVTGLTAVSAGARLRRPAQHHSGWCTP
jgi:hypothetical protein